MSYVYNTLLPNEEIRYEAKIHWSIYLIPLYILFTIFLLSFFFIISSAIGIGIMVILGGLISGISSLIAAYLNRRYSEFVVTNKRIILKRGFLGRGALELQIHKAEAIGLREPLLGRMLGFGTLVVTTGGATNVYRNIENPYAFIRAVNIEIDRNKG